MILLILSVEYAAQVYGWRVSERAWTRLAAGVTVVVIVLGLVGAVAGLQAYAQGRYEASPHRLAIDTLKAQAESGATVIVDDQTTYEQLYPCSCAPASTWWRSRPLTIFLRGKRGWPM